MSRKAKAQSPQFSLFDRPADAPSGAAAVDPLGIYAKTAATPILEPPAAGEYVRAVAIVERYALQAQARKAIPEFKVNKCLRTRLPYESASIWQERETKTAHWKGLQVCASVWHCPVCAARIANHRRVELRAALDTAAEKELTVYLVTFTAPHYVSDDVNVLLKGMQAAWRRFTADRSYKGTKELMRFVGLVRAYEVTYGPNGFHPHYHALFICQGVSGEVVSPYQLEEWLYDPWRRACVRSGLPEPSRQHGVDVRPGEEAAEYVGKWGLEHEMTTHQSKRGKKDSLHPWDFLRLALEGDERMLSLFKVYARAFHGKRQLFWSRGLKALLVPEEIQVETDEEIMATEEPSDQLAKLTEEQWYSVRYFNAQAHCLNAAERGGTALIDFLNELVQHVPANILEQKMFKSLTKSKPKI